MKLVLWFEPERCAANTWITQTHPEWVLGGAGGGLVNLGHPEMLKWAIEHFDKLIKEQGVDLYREDFNIDPLDYWRKNDAPERQGMTENLYLQGHLAFWDELRRRHPDMLIDSCASGGRRNDLETLRRAVPLLRSDFHGPGVYDQPALWYGNQGHTYGMSMWVPFSGKGEFYNSNYAFRSQICPSMGVGYDPARPIDWPALKKTIVDWRAVADEFYGDFYPLTKYTLSEDDWMAWQFDRPEQGKGMIQAFRHTNSLYESARFKLQGLDPAASYLVTNLDAPGETEVSGRELSEQGLLIVIKDRPAAVLYTYKKKP
jgi:alpha-galactosidase